MLKSSIVFILKGYGKGVLDAEEHGKTISNALFYHPPPNYAESCVFRNMSECWNTSRYLLRFARRMIN